MVKRFLQKTVEEKLGRGKAVIIMGARQTGKTTLMKEIVKGQEDMLWLDGDEIETQTLLEKASVARFKLAFARYKTVVIDEAQRIRDIGQKLKLITDHLPEVSLLVSGSASFEISNQVNEPMTGRKWEYTLHPLSLGELVEHHGFMEENRILSHRLVYGHFPEVVSRPGHEKEILKQLSDSYLFKDILIWENIKHSDKLIKLLQALALQLGNEVSYNEIGRTLAINSETVSKYIDLLEKVFVVFRMPAFSRNIRKELKKSRKIYFHDNGVRNALIANFAPLELRNDVGALWENYLVSERTKLNSYRLNWANSYFWRTLDQQEIDYIEEIDGKLHAFEFKWRTGRKGKIPRVFSLNYPGSTFKSINRDNYEEFLLD